MQKINMAIIGAGIWGETPDARGRCLSIMSNKNSMFCAREIVYSWIIPATEHRSIGKGLYAWKTEDLGWPAGAAKSIAE